MDMTATNPLATIPETVTVTEAARVLGVQNRTVHDWIKRGKLLAITLPSGRRKIKLETIKDIFQQEN